MIDTLDIQVSKIEESRISEVDFDNIVFGREYSDHMFIADFKDGQWGDYRIVPYQHLKLKPANVTLHYGQSVFEGMKAHRDDKGNILLFRPLDNFRRLNRSGERLCIPPVSEELFMGALRELLQLDEAWVPSKPNTSLYVRPYIFATDEYIGIKPSDTYKFMVITCPVGAYYSAPVKVKIETHYSRACQGGTGYAKAAGNYSGSLYPAVQAQKEGYQQLMWTDAGEHRYIEESGTMNLMFVIDNKLITPATSDSILAGITRDSVITLAKDWGMEVEERRVEVTEVIDALKSREVTEVFGTGTAATIAPIKAIGYEGIDYELPPVEGWEFSSKVLKTLEDYKRGKIDDKYNWIVKI